MILVKPYQIAAGGSRYDVPGAKFFLLAASEPLNVELYAGTQRVGEVDGMQGGLEVGPFCPALTGFKVTTQSGLAGSALIGVGEEEMSYNPLAGALSFTNPAAGAIAVPVITTLGNQTSHAQQNFGVSASLAAVAAAVPALEISNGGSANGKTATINGIHISNPGAVAINVTIAVVAASVGLNGTQTINNFYTNGVASAFSCTANTGAPAGFPGPPTIKILKVINIAAGGSQDIDLSRSPIILPVGTAASLWIVSDTVDQAITYGVEWSEQ